MRNIQPCLWFDDDAEEAARLYTSLFPHSKIGIATRYGEAGAKMAGRPVGSPLTVEFQIDRLPMLGLNGGPIFKHSPSLSFFVWCETEGEIDGLWKALSPGGTVRMGLDKYPWSPKYGWTTDRFGVEWQLNLQPHSAKIAPAFLFTDALFGKGEEAIRFYTSVFPSSRIESLVKDDKTKTVMHATFKLGVDEFVLMEGAGKHGHKFSEAFSLMVRVQTQEEIDEYWAKLTKGGAESQCGWLKDKYGVSWQITPTAMEKWMSNPRKYDAVMKAFAPMKKLNLKVLEEAFEKG